MKFTVILAILSVVAYAESAAVTCNFNTDTDWTVVGHVYTCHVQNSLNIVNRAEAIIESVYPVARKTVKIFNSAGKRVHYFPRNLDKLFPSLIGIAISSANLKEVRKDDLRPFPSLRFINFWENDIEFLEQDLFAFNPNLQVVGFWANRISHIDLNVFDHLHKLSYLWLNLNECIDKGVENDKAAVKSFISQLKLKCFNPNNKVIENHLITSNGEYSSTHSE